MKRQHLISIARAGFTLVELLVVMGLIALLAALMIGFFPSVTTSAREARAATMLQTWLNTAKQRALRDQRPTGLRLLMGANNSLQVVECQYISQPDDFWQGKIYVDDTAAPPFNTLSFSFTAAALAGTLNTKVDLFNGYTSNLGGPNPYMDEQFWAVQRGDFLEVSGASLMYRITGLTSVSNPDGTVTNKITITPPLPNRISSSTWATYRIVRGSRALGDEPLKLPDNTIIDLNQNFNSKFTPGNPLPLTNDSATGLPLYFEILFAPSGQVITRNLSRNKIHLWVRAPNIDDKDNPFKGDPTLVSIFARTGFIGAYSPNAAAALPAGGNPYTFVK